jgi:tRNA nucleotidyltransferase (CCA-adding enzyme)
MFEEVLRRIKPSRADFNRLGRVVKYLSKRIERVAKSRGIEVTPLLVGSAARGTWLRTERELDIFLMFPERLSREELQTQGLSLAKEVARGKGREQFAEHPYVTMDFEGFRVDLVPCFDIKDPSKLKSAVDRTPHHQRYVREYLTPKLADQVLLLKQFVRGIGVYGAEARVQGFSGYLCELLILSRGSFEKLLEEVAGWKPGVVIDLERAYPNEAEPKILFERQPLIVVDPVDPKRNVAAALSLRSFSMFVLACREFLRKPKLEFFFPRRLRPLTPKGFKRLLKSRGTKLCCLHVKHPNLPEDVIYPQLRKTERAISNELVQAGFEVLRSDVWANEHSAVVLVELSIFRLPQVQARPGPRLTLDVSDFLLEHLESPRRLAGPFVDDAGRVVYELKRQETDATRFLSWVVANCRGFGKNVAESIERGDYALLTGEEITRLFRNRGFRKFITQYLDPRLPWYR